MHCHVWGRNRAKFDDDDFNSFREIVWDTCTHTRSRFYGKLKVCFANKNTISKWYSLSIWESPLDWLVINPRGSNWREECDKHNSKIYCKLTVAFDLFNINLVLPFSCLNRCWKEFISHSSLLIEEEKKKRRQNISVLHTEWGLVRLCRISYVAYQESLT